jgi:two-component system chemotaxis sensor kinase CheA
MDDLLREFLTETGESLDTVDNQLVRFEQDPNNAKKRWPMPARP